MVTRRGFVKGTMLGGLTALTVGSLATMRSLLSIGVAAQIGEVNEGFIYTSAGRRLWYSGRLRQEARPSHFREIGLGATTLWRALFDEDGELIPGTGWPALLMRLDSAKIVVPEGLEEPVSADGFVAVFNTCVHLCCNPGLNFAKTTIEQPPIAEDVLRHPDDTLTQPVVDPAVGVIYCPCHHSTYDPFRLVWEPDASRTTHPNNPVRYLGANWVWGPAQRALPVIPVQIAGQRIIGLNTHPEWYRGYCGL